MWILFQTCLTHRGVGLLVGACPLLLLQTPVFPDVTISKSPASLSVPIGSNASYSIIVSNVGGAAASSVVVTETLPAGLVYVSGPAGAAQQADAATACRGVDAEDSRLQQPHG